MKKDEAVHLTKSENLLMDILWDSERPLTRPEILERVKDSDGEGLPLSTFHLLVNNLLEKGYIISAAEAGGRIKRHTRRFAASVTRNEHRALSIVRSKNFKADDIPAIVGALFRFAGIKDPARMLQKVKEELLGKQPTESTAGK